MTTPTDGEIALHLAPALDPAFSHGVRRNRPGPVAGRPSAVERQTNAPSRRPPGEQVYCDGRDGHARGALQPADAGAAPALRQSSELLRKVVGFYRALKDEAVPVKNESALRLELRNGSRIVSLPGDETTIRGYSGVRLLVVDEAVRVPDDLYFSIRPMLAVSGGRLVCLSTPFGKRGFFQRSTRAQY
jgi:hypothetical protein